ncbi:MAG: IS1634 family transposase [Actinobacteria bacterium]|nr:IS1634 family transposase [Actinomycetota bacterium]
MFLRISTTTEAGRAYRYLKVVESYRAADGRHRQRVVCSLGRVEELVASGALGRWRALLAQAEGLPSLGPEALAVRDARAFGGPYVLDALWQELGLPGLLGAAEADRRQFDAALAVEVMVLNRLLAPRSKLAVQRWAPGIALGSHALAALDYQHYLRALDLLHARRAELETALFLRVCDLFGLELDVVFYDLTSSYFEGANCAWARHGYSRDHRPDRPQVVLGLAVTREGLPIAHRVWAGNTADVTTLGDMVVELRGRFRIGRCLLVADRGMVSTANLVAIRAAGFRYLIALKRRQGELVRAAIGDGDLAGYAPVQDGLWAKEVPGPEGDRLIVCHSAERAAEEQTWRAELIADSEADLARLQRRARQLNRDALVAAATQILRASYGYRYLWYAVDAAGHLTYGRNQAALAEELARDGKFVLRTNDAALPVAEAALAYKQLQRVERGFRELKDFLQLRPVRHFRPDRVEAHVAVCVLAYLLEMVLEQKLARAGLPMTAQAALEALAPVQQVRTEVNGRQFDCLTDWPQPATKILRALHLETPPKTVALDA